MKIFSYSSYKIIQFNNKEQRTQDKKHLWEVKEWRLQHLVLSSNDQKKSMVTEESWYPLTSNTANEKI